MAKSKETKDKHFIKKPTYRGGLTAMRQFLTKNMRYPKAALKEKVEGTVYVKYTIDYKGNVIDTKVLSSLGSGCDEEAVRLVKMFKFDVPKNRKMKIQFHKNIQIHFRLPKKVKPSKQNMSIQYNYTSTNKSKKDTPPSTSPSPKKGDSYTYTISF